MMILKCCQVQSLPTGPEVSGWVSGEGIGGVVQSSFQPLSSEIVAHNFSSEALKTWVFNLV